MQKAGEIAGEIAIRPLILLPPRDWLYARCDERFARMIEQGAVEEVKALLERKLNPSLPVMRAIGVSKIAAYLRGEMNLEQTISAGQQATRRYAKRQYTWFAHQPPAEWPRFSEAIEGEQMAEALALLLPIRSG
jgi:tRNA dimethylallyltransferase